MARYDTSLWLEIRRRLSEVLPRDLQPWAMAHKLSGVRLDLVMTGRKGLSIETLVTLCAALDLSPSWLLFGQGRKSLTGERHDDEADPKTIAADPAHPFSRKPNGGKKHK